MPPVGVERVVAGGGCRYTRTAGLSVGWEARVEAGRDKSQWGCLVMS